MSFRLKNLMPPPGHGMALDMALSAQIMR